MNRQRKPVTQRSAGGPQKAFTQEALWPDGQAKKADTHSAGAPREGAALRPLRTSARAPAPLPDNRRSLQDLLLAEGLRAVMLSVDFSDLADLQEALVHRLGQNSMETRIRYAQTIIRWFFPDGLEGLARRTWAAYQDEKIEADILRYLYLSDEPIMGACVAEALYPVQDGMIIPPGYLDRFLGSFLKETPPAKTRERLKTNLMKLGFLSRARGKPDRLVAVAPTKTTFLILLHYIFAPGGARTVELTHLLAHPFWKYLGYKSDDAVRAVLREADATGLLGKYVVADQLEQVTTCLTLLEILERRVRL